MAKIALSCIACGRELRNVDDMVTENQPYNGTAFQSHGHYGDGHYLEINVCDSCLVLHHERVLVGRDRRPVMEDGSVEGWEDCNWALVPWTPDSKEIGHVLGITLRESGVILDDKPEVWLDQIEEPE